MDILSSLPEIDEHARYVAVLSELRDLYGACSQAPEAMRMALGENCTISNIKLWLCPPVGPLEGLWMEFEIRVPWLHGVAAASCSPWISAAPPVILAKSRLFHPNVTADGRICLGLRTVDGKTQDVSILGAVNILMCLLQNPEDGADDAVNPLAAQMIADGRYKAYCRDWLERAIPVDGWSQ